MVVRIGCREETECRPFRWEIQFERGAMFGEDRDFDEALRTVLSIIRS
jgi:hypothetical protein